MGIYAAEIIVFSVLLIFTFAASLGCYVGREEAVPLSSVTCNLGGIKKEYKHVRVHYAMQSWAHDIFFDYMGKRVHVQDTYCIVEEE